MRIPNEIRAALEQCGHPYSLERGSRHIKIKVAGVLAGILPLGGKANSSDKRSTKNTIAQIRRAARGDKP